MMVDYDRRAAASYTSLYYDLVETLRQLRDEYQADLEAVGQQAITNVAPKLARGVPYHKLYVHLVEVLKSLRILHGEDPKRIYQMALETLRHESPRLASGPWAWRPVKGPPGTGYVTQNGRAELRKVPGQPRSSRNKWVLVLDGKEHPIVSRTPGFDHADALLHQLVGPEFAHAER